MFNKKTCFLAEQEDIPGAAAAGGVDPPRCWLQVLRRGGLTPPWTKTRSAAAALGPTLKKTFIEHIRDIPVMFIVTAEWDFLTAYRKDLRTSSLPLTAEAYRLLLPRHWQKTN